MDLTTQGLDLLIILCILFVAIGLVSIIVMSVGFIYREFKWWYKNKRKKR